MEFPTDSPLILMGAIALGAIPGALGRYFLLEWSLSVWGHHFPIGTVLINLSGCFLMGFFFTLSQEISSYPPELDLFIRTGFLGSYTTFSTYGYDTLTLWRKRNLFLTLLYWLGSAFFGIIAVYLGTLIAQVWV